MDALNGLIAKLERRTELEKARARAGGELDRARGGVARFTTQRSEAREAAARFNEALGRVYGDRVAARRAIRSFAQREGLDAAAREIAAHPQRFGELHGTEHGPIRSGRRNEALHRAEELSRATDAYLPRAKLARENRRDYRDARAALVRAETKVGRLEAELERGPGAAQLRLLVREKLRAVQPRVRRELEVRLSASQRLLLGTSLALGVAFVREQGHER